jgi:hypothetical protein
MNVNVTSSFYSSSDEETFDPDKTQKHRSLLELIRQELAQEVGGISTSMHRVSQRITTEVERVCEKSNRIQNSGQIEAWKISLARHRLRKCLYYYQLGSQGGRVELHSKLSVIVYRYIAPAHAGLGFQARYNLLEDFLQDFYTESLKAFRRENDVPEDYQPRTRLELAEYMAFTEQYGKRRITLPNGYSQQLIILRAQTFARRLPKETAVDIDQAGEYGRDEDGEGKIYSGTMQQVRSRLVSQMSDPAEEVLRDRVVNALFQYLEAQGHSDCADYLALKLQDLSATEIDEVLNLTSRQRDYLQQRFKYHVEKFSRSSHWRLVHQWLGADLEEKLGMTDSQWQHFVEQLSPKQRQILVGKQGKENDEEIAKKAGLTLKKVHKQWTQALELAATIRNQG